MTDTKKTGSWFSLTCRSTIKYGRNAGLRCYLFRWHVGPHQGGDINGPCWGDFDRPMR